MREFRTKTAPATATVVGGETMRRATHRFRASGISSVSASTVAISGRVDIAERVVQRVGLAAVRIAADRDPLVELGTEGGPLDRLVGRAVIGDQDAELARIVLGAGVIERLLDHLLPR